MTLALVEEAPAAAPGRTYKVCPARAGGSLQARDAEDLDQARALAAQLAAQRGQPHRVYAVEASGAWQVIGPAIEPPRGRG